METKQVQKYEPNQEFLTTIERLATNPEVDVQKIEALLNMQERILDRRNQEEFNRDMLDVQMEIKPIIKTKANPNKGYYAPLDKVIEHTEPIYTKKGFSLTFYEEDSYKENHVRVCCDIMHRNGFTKKSHIDMAVVTTGPKGTQMMTTIDAEASAFTKGRRYLMCNIFNIPTTDDDGRKAGESPGDFITNEQATELNQLRIKVGMGENLFLRALKVEELSLLPKNEFGKAKGILNAKKK